MSEPAQASPTDGSADEGAGPGATTVRFRGGPAMSGLPIVFFIVWAILQSVLFRISAADGLVPGMLIGLILGMLFVKGSWRAYAEAIFEGMSQKVVVTAIVAWLWAGMFASTLQAGGFVGGLGWLAQALGIGPTLLPAITFLCAGLLATGIGTGYGTTIAMCTLFFPAGVALGASPVLMFGAILSGAVFGDNLAPVSDTTIVSAVTQESDIGGVVASRFKYAAMAALGAGVLYLIAATVAGDGQPIAEAQALFEQKGQALGLVHMISMGVVIATAVAGRHIIEAISWGLIVAVALNLGSQALAIAFVNDNLALASASDMLLFKVPEGAPGAGLAWLPIVEQVPAGKGLETVTGSIPSGAAGFFGLSILILLIIAGAQVMIRGGAFQAIEQGLLRVAARTVRGGEMTLVLSTALINAAITINTAAEIAIAPYISSLGKRFNINGYRRANILDANTSALGYIFPWSGGVLIGYATIAGLVDQFDWFTSAMVVNPLEVVPVVFHGWLLVLLFIFAAWTGFGREYIPDRKARRSAQI